MENEHGARSRAIRWVSITILTMCVLSAGPAAADDPTAGVDRWTILEQRIAAGDLEYRDPKTGAIVVATEEGIAFLRSQLAPHFGPYPENEPIVLADGTVKAPMNGAIRDVYLVRTNLDGTRAAACVRSLDAAVAFLVGLDRENSKTPGPSRPVVDK